MKNTSAYYKGRYRELFDVEAQNMKLKVYIKSKLKIYEVILADKAELEREEFCASKFSFTVMKDNVVSFNQGDAVSVMYDSEGIFYGYVFSKSRDKKGLIRVECYDQIRYLKNRRTYTRGRMRLDEMVNKIASDNNLRVGKIQKSSCYLQPVAADNLSLIDVIKKGCKDTERLSGEKFIFYDECGLLMLKKEDELVTDILIDASQAENFVYTDRIDKGVYNTVEVYNDTKRLDLRTVTAVSDKENVDAWGTLVLSKKATDASNAKREAENLLRGYNKVNREIVISKIAGDNRFLPGGSLWVKLVMGDLDINGFVRIHKVRHVFENNQYYTDLYLDGSDVNEYS